MRPLAHLKPRPAATFCTSPENGADTGHGETRREQAGCDSDNVEEAALRPRCARSQSKLAGGARAARVPQIISFIRTHTVSEFGLAARRFDSVRTLCASLCVGAARDLLQWRFHRPGRERRQTRSRTRPARATPPTPRPRMDRALP